MRAVIAVLAIHAMMAVVARPVHAQAPLRTDRWATDTATTSTTGIAFVASAILPGAGQRYLKSDRWLPFVAVEAWAWVKYLDHRSRGRELEQDYRDLAWNVARRLTTSARRDSVFTYYEAIAQFDNSGLFDAEPLTPGLQPEPDSTTFNGIQWRRARALFLRGVAAVPGTPEFEQALAFYRSNAIPEGYTWSWGNNRLEQRTFQETIARSDAAFRAATRMMGVILANHIVSAVDALVQARVKILTEQRLRVGSTLEPHGSSYLWTTTVSIPLHGAKSVDNSRTNR
ncbi:MAG: hypothetical protein ACT4O1_00705 [Gemmatimonadota bacterium]